MPRRKDNALKHRQSHKQSCKCRYCRVKRSRDPAEVSSRR